MSEEKVKELQEFVDIFTDKLKEAYHTYEVKQKNVKILKKSLSQIEQRKTDENTFPSLLNNNSKIRRNNSRIITSKNKIIKKNIINPQKIWKPQKRISNYFEEFKRLQNEKQLNSWEKVCKYYY
jgi:hypothetical protein